MLTPLAWAEKQDLITTYLQALDNDPVLQAALATRLATREDVPIAMSQLLPQASISFYNQSDTAIGFAGIGVPDTFEEPTVSRTYGYIANASQTLFNWGTWSTVRQSFHIADQADAAFLASEQNLILRVAQAYFDILSAEDTLTFAIAKKEALASQLDQTQQRFDVGLVAITDVYDFQAQYDAQLAEEIKARNHVQDTKEALQVITGLPVDELFPLQPTIPLKHPEPPNMEAWVKEAEYNNPVLAATQFNMQATEQAINVAEAGHYPNLVLAGQYDRTFGGQVLEPIDGTAESGWGIGLESTMNLFTGGAVVAQVRQAEYQYEAARDAFEQQRRLTVSETRTAYRNIDAALSEVLALQQAVLSAQSSLDANVASYEVGVKTSVDVLDSISLLYQQQQNLALARYNYIISILTLKQQAGIIEVMDLVRMNQWLKLEKQINDRD